MKIRALLSLAVLCLAAGCSFKSPAEGLDFQAPAGWTSTPSMFGFQMWMKTSKDGEVMMLINHKGKMNADFNINTVPGTTKGEILARKDIHICENQPAKFYEMSGTTNGKPAVTEMVLTTYEGDNNYMSMYTRPKSVTADRQAEAAIKMLCIKKS